MYETLAEMGVEFGSVAGRALGAASAAVAGFLLEVNGFQTLGTGEQVIGLWMAWVGCLLLVAGYLLAGDAMQLFGRSTH